MRSSWWKHPARTSSSWPLRSPTIAQNRTPRCRGKFRRTNTPLTLELEPTPDLLAGVSSRRRPGQYLVGFALEPRADLITSAKSKLERKGVDLVVANPLETMDSDDIEAILVAKDGSMTHSPGGEGVKMSKKAFVGWLLGELSKRLNAVAAGK